MYRIFFACLLFTGYSPAYGQTEQFPTDSTLYEVITLENNVFHGYKVSENESRFVLATTHFGELSISRVHIKSIKIIPGENMVKGSYYFDNVQSTRYFWSPNGYGLKKGEGYYQNVWIFFNQFAVGVTDNISVGAGLMPLFLLDGTASPVWITPKISIPVVDNLNVGLGGLFGTVIGEEGTGFGVIYGATTWGSRDKNINVGVGWGYSEFGFAERPTITLSGMYRFGPRFYLLSENYFLTTGSDEIRLFSVGGRSILTKVSIDYGLFIYPETSESSFGVYAIPWLGLVVPFGQRDYYKR